MSYSPLVTIIIPVYNGSNYLKEAIESSLAQTYHNIEVIVVNDGSKDDGATESIAKSFGDKIKYFYKENGGVASALNVGIKESKGEYLSWLSHDDMYLSHKIKYQLDFLGDKFLPRQILYGDFQIFDVPTGKSSINLTPSVSPGNYLCEALYLLFGGAIHGCTLLLPKACFDEVGLFNEDLRTVQDYDLWFKLLKARYEFRHIQGPLIVTRHHEGQGTLSMADIHRQEVERLYIWAFDEFFESFKCFSLEQVASFVMLLKNKNLTEAPFHIIKRWPDNQVQRDCLMSYLQDQDINKKTVFRTSVKKLVQQTLLTKLATAKNPTLEWIFRLFEKR
ncbi:MAG: family 2 glycosyl transferase [Geobacter sp.]|nr:MAG: family 2 glycosyl transferase [Geobacter sp.]